MMDEGYQQEKQSEPIFAIHGWGLNSAVFDSLSIEQATGRKVISVDLPGHGGRYNEKLGTDAQKIAQDLLDKAPPKAVWMGWSIGGMLALLAAQKAPDCISALVIISASPSFIARERWRFGIDKKSLQAMEKDLANNPKKTVKNFLTSIVSKDSNGRHTLRTMRKALQVNGQASQTALEDGLKLLQTMDLTEKIEQIKIPTLIIGGEDDWLVNPKALKEFSNKLNPSKLVLLRNCAHAAFITQEKAFNQHLNNFLSNL